jgi:thiamine pyrophosphate-dependent acetolactate synthase large subunit-like protein
MKVTGAQALFRALEGEGVDLAFGIPGGAILPAYDPLIDSKVRHVLCRHEQGAGHAAEGYAWATGKVGVAIATSGPGGCNLVTALADAKMDSVPMVAITGQVPTPVVGNDAFQEADITGITMPITKHNFLVTDANQVAETIREAFHIARTGRPGPVLVDIPKDVQLPGDHLALARGRRPARLQPDDEGQPEAGPHRGPDDHAGEAPGPLRRRRRDQGEREQGTVRSSRPTDSCPS